MIEVIKKKIKDFKNYRINSSLMKVTNDQSIFLHCLPRGNEVSEDVFLGKQSKVWQQALNKVMFKNLYYVIF